MTDETRSHYWRWCADPASALLPGRGGGGPRLCRRPNRLGLPYRRCSGSYGGRRVSILRVRYPAADALHSGESAKDIPGGGNRSRERRQGAGISDRPRRLLLFRSGVEGVLPVAAAAHHGRHHRLAGAGVQSRNRSHRRQAGRQTRSHYWQWCADPASALLPGRGGGGPRLCRRPNRLGLPYRRCSGSYGGRRVSILRVRYPAADALHSGEFCERHSGRREPI